MDDTEARILQDIERTRAAMTEKIGLIQGRMDATVEETGATVAKVVNSVLDQVKRAQDLFAHIASTADGAIARVQATAEHTTDKGTPAAELITEVYQRPWIMLGTAVLMGYVLGSARRSSTALSPAQTTLPPEDHGQGFTTGVPTGNPFIAPSSPPAGRAPTSSPGRMTEPAGTPSTRP